MATKLFVGGLAWTTDSDSLRTHFEQFGEITDAEVIVDRDSRRSRGFGFVTLASSSDAQEAIDKTNDQMLDGRKIRVDFAGERSSSFRRPSYGAPSRERSGGFGGDRRRNTRYDARPQRDGYERPRSSRPFGNDRRDSSWARDPTDEN